MAKRKKVRFARERPEVRPTKDGSARERSAEERLVEAYEGKSPYWPYVGLAFVILLFVLIRIRLLNFPLERDEGEYAYAGQLMLRGLAPYSFCYTMKLPGTAAAYAVILGLFGQSTVAVHLGLLLVNSAAIILLYLLAARLFGRTAGVVAAASFGLLSIESAVLGFAAHATQFVVPCALGGVLLILKAIESHRLRTFFASGLLLGLAFLMKQPGIVFFLFGFFYTFFLRWRLLLQRRTAVTEAGMFCLGCAVPFAMTCLWLLLAGDFSKFWFWTQSYAGQYGSILDFRYAMLNFRMSVMRVIQQSVLMWLVAFIGLITLPMAQAVRKHAFFVIAFSLFSFAAVCPGFYFRPHYFILLLPAVALSCAAAVSSATAQVTERQGRGSPAVILPVLAFTFLFACSIFQQRQFFFREDLVSACRRIYPGEPFPEAPKIAEFLRRRAAEDDRIAVLGSEPEIYFYSQRLSATGYIYVFPFIEPQPFASMMQQEMMREITASHPRFVVIVDCPTSWTSIRSPRADSSVLNWTERYVQNDYQLIGVVDVPRQRTEDEPDSNGRRSRRAIFIFQRMA